LSYIVLVPIIIIPCKGIRVVDKQFKTNEIAASAYRLYRNDSNLRLRGKH